MILRVIAGLYREPAIMQKQMSSGIVCQIEAYVMEAGGRNQRRLTENPAGDYWPD